MIGVGINENVYISKIARSEKSALEIYFSEGAAEIANNPFASLQKDEIIDTTMDTKLMIFPFNVPKKEDWTKEKKIEMVSMDIQDVKNQLTHIALQYMTADKVKFGNIFRNTGIESSEDFDLNILDENILKKVFDNLAGDFIEMMKPFVGDSKLRFRLKLLRQSADKHFATLPKKYLKENPFMEPAETPKDQSKVKFSKWEKDNKLDDPTPTAKAAADQPGEPAPSDPSAVFGSRS